ncbi:MAG: LysR family transcriptional regulator [Chloroflexi bacterium]|nr:LysR family transcriptional regulator [Chloroflexota bacterium]
MNLSQLEVLVAIVDSGSLTEAGEAVGLTQSAVSYSLSRLEAELGVTLLERGRQGVVMTRVGAEIVQHARAVLNQIEAIRQKSARDRGLSVGKLRFGCVTTIPPRLLTGMLRDFQRRYPDIDVVLFEGTPRELLDWLETGVIDIATVVRPDGFALSTLFLHAEIAAIVSTRHRLAQQAEVTLQELAQEPFIGPKAEYGVNPLLGQQTLVMPRLRHEVSTPDTIFAMVRENMGVALVLKMLIDPDADGIAALQLSPRLSADIYLVSNIRSPAAEVFLESASVWANAHGFSADVS